MNKLHGKHRVCKQCANSYHNIKLVCKGYAMCALAVCTSWKLFGNCIHFLTVSKCETAGIQIWKLFVHVRVQTSVQCVHQSFPCDMKCTILESDPFTQWSLVLKTKCCLENSCLYITRPPRLLHKTLKLRRQNLSINHVGMPVYCSLTLIDLNVY